jgi:hypothetical protein
VQGPVQSGLASVSITSVLLFVLQTTFLPKMENLKDERLIEPARIGASNVFIFIIVGYPIIAAMIMLDIIVIDPVALLFALLLVSIAIVWITIAYYYRK